MHREQDLLRRIMGMQAVTTIAFLFLGGSVVLRVTEGSDSWQKTERYAELGTEVLLPCNLKLPQCEGLHSIKWYRGSTRIFIFSMDAGIIRSNSGIAARADIEYSTNSSKTYLKIPEVQLEDGGLYRCEATYLAVKRECNNVQLIFLNITMQPAFIRVIDDNSKNTLSTGATLGPINEGSTIALYCESGKGKPIPTVEWFKGDQPIEATSLSTITDTGIGAGSSLLKMQITREELDATFTCKVNSIALVEPLSVNIKLDVHVRPLEMGLSGVVDHVVQGTKILLQCKVLSARPAANVTWQNGTQWVNESNERYDLLETKIHENEDSTSDTISYLAFTASVYDNGRTFKCYAENSVTNTEDLKPMMKSTTIEVLYPPIIKMKPHNITVNETNDFLIFCDYEANPASLNKVTWLRDDEELVLNDEHYDGGITEQTALTVKNATPNDMGFYKCILQNNAGISISEKTVEVSVFYKPVVEVVMDPETPVNEADRVNVSLTCEVDAGNPATLSAVRWYLDGDLLKELPDCPRNSTAMTASTEESSTFCDIDPSKLLLESVGRSFHGNYSCEGRNEAGWGPISPSTPVIVYYKPGPASIFYEPRHVVKKQSLSITCFILDPGRPKVSSFKWLRGGHRLAGENNVTVVIESVNLETEANFTCMAHNEAGDGEPASTFIDVSAAPTFIKKMHSYRGFVYNSPNVSIMCWVECAPICNISWLKDDIAIDFSKTNRYYVSDVYHPPNLRTNDFESVQSTLVWNLTAWPNGQLDRADDSVKFTCKSTSNGIGPGVESSTHFHVEFPPENIAISKKIINVTVDTIPETVECSAKARPKASFRWFREGSTDTIMEGHVLDFKVPLPRRSNGTYYCEASNYHGFLNVSMVINVQFKPECHIKKERVDGQDYVVCSAIANPEKTDFTWSLKNDNDTLEQGAKTRNGKSYMLIDTSVTNLRTYVCVANNTIGYSMPCERDIPGHIPWWYQLEGNLLLIIIIVTVIIILVLILICVAIFIVCRRKSSEMKYPNQANNNHVNSVSEALPDSGTKTFYENLPFHGIQAPPNKTVILPMPGRLAAQWFPSSQVSTATSLCIFGNQVGIALSFLLTPVIVRNHENLDDIGSDLSRLCWVVAIVTTVGFVLALTLFQNEPKLPPSETRALQKINRANKEEKFVAPIKSLCKNKSYLILCNSYGLNVGVLNAVATLLNQIFLAHFENGEEDAGRIGLAMIITGMAGSVTFGIILDKTHKFKETAVTVYFLTFCGQILFAIFTCLGIKWMVYVSAIFLGFFMSGYLALGYDLCIEYTYPESENVSTGILNIANNVYGVILVIIFGLLLKGYSDIPVHIGLCSALLLGFILTVLTKDEQRRQDARKKAQSQEKAKIEKSNIDDISENHLLSHNINS